LEIFHMKKTLVALAVLAASGATFAQSTATISGALVLGVGTTEFGTNKSDLQIARQTGNINFGATEDLGGGLRAGFQLQTSIGAVATTDTNTSQVGRRTILGDRGANITVSGGFGTVLVGRAAMAIRSQFATADVSNLPVVSGLSAASSAAAAGTTSSGVADGGIVVAGGDANARIIYGDTYANQVGYLSPRVAGFGFSIGTVPVQDTSAANPAGIGDSATTKDTWSYTLSYASGPLNASINLTDQPGSAANPSSVVGVKLTTIVANYDFGVAKIGLAQQSIALDSGVNPGDGWSLTLAVPLGSGNVALGYGNRAASASTSTSFGDDVTQNFIGYRYNLSKRTSVSFTYNKIDRAGSATDLSETHILLGHSF